LEGEPTTIEVQVLTDIGTRIVVMGK